MKCSLYIDRSLAAGVLLTLAAFLIAACGVEAVQSPAAMTLTSTVPTMPASPSPSSTPSTPTVMPSTIPLTPTPIPSPTTLTPTLPPPSSTPASTATTLEKKPTPAASSQAPVNPGVMVSETTVTLPTYSMWDYLVEQVDPRYNMPVFYFDRLAYEAAAPTPSPVDYTGVVLENEYLKLTLLPELGGRLYGAVFKPTGQEIFYHNPVVKPSRYGVLQPWEANWWLAAGGMEWAYPTQEHGYRWGVPWDYQLTQSDIEATITLSDMAVDRVGVKVEVTLPADSSAFTVTPKLVNATSATVPVQFWLNAALALDSPSMSPRTQFIVPTDSIIVHSRGEAGWTVPDAGEQSPWPLVDETDLSDYRQWANYVGFFVPNMKAPFIGAYNPDTDLGVVRLIEPGAVPGNKLFAFGLPFLDRSYTDDDSQYFEIWGGANTGFWPEDDIELPPGQILQWQERWWPLAGLGGLTWANQDASIYLDQTGDAYNLSLMVSRPRQGLVTVLAGETPVLTESFAADPAEALHWDFSAPTGPVRVKIEDSSNTLLMDYCPAC